MKRADIIDRADTDELKNAFEITHKGMNALSVILIGESSSIILSLNVNHVVIFQLKTLNIKTNGSLISSWLIRNPCWRGFSIVFF